MTTEYRTVTSPTRHPEDRCPDCGESYHHFPKGLEANGTTVYWSCANCSYAVAAEKDRRAQR